MWFNIQVWYDTKKFKNMRDIEIESPEFLLLGRRQVFQCKIESKLKEL